MQRDWKIIDGNISILLVASHNYPHIRKGNIKPGDIGTGALVELLCKITGAWGIVSTSVQPDPNWYSNSLFRKRVNKLLKKQNIKFVLDIHGRRENYPYLLEILPNNKFKKLAINLNKLFYLRELKNNEQLTLSEDLDKKEIPCAEIEIRKDGRVKELNDENYHIVTKTLIEFVQSIFDK